MPYNPTTVTSTQTYTQTYTQNIARRVCKIKWQYVYETQREVVRVYCIVMRLSRIAQQTYRNEKII